MTPLPELARAHWIWPGTLYDDPVNVYAHFHRVVDVDRVPPSVVTHITADAEYQLYVNGHYAARGPARGYQPHWPVDEVDIAQFLRTGGNVIAIIAHNPGVGTFRYRSESYAGVMVSMAIGDTRLVSDRSWRCRIDPSRARTTPKLSKQMGFQEQVDLRFDDRAWMTAPEASLGADWRVPSARPYGSAPWHATEPRGLPMLTRRQMPYAREVARAAFAEPGRGDTHAMTRPTSLHRRQIEAAEWTASDSSAIENGMLCVGVPEIEAGHARAITLDLGRASIGELLVEARGSTGGELLDVLFTEDITQHGCPVFAGDASDGHIDMATRVVLGCGTRGPCAHEAFQVIGHRYATMVVSGPAPAIALRVAHRETRCPIDVVGSFQCDDATLNDIYRISENTQRNCMMDAYVDTPWREQAQWWGDARVQAWNTFALANDPRLLRRGLRQIADPAQEVPNGLTYGHAPTIAHDCILPDFTCVWMLTIWDDYFHSGDPCMFAELWPRVSRAITYFESFDIADGGLVPADPRYWLFLDWTDGLPRTGCPTLLNMMLLEALESAADLAEIVRPGGASDRVRPLAETLRRTIETRLWDEASGRFHDGIGADGVPFQTHAIHNQVQAVLCGLHPEAHETIGAEVLHPFLMGTSNETAQPTPFWMTYVYEAARRLGLNDAALQHLAKKWAPMIETGGTWERFDPPGTGNTSGSHAWSAHPLYHLPRIAAGLTPATPGWGRVRFEPPLRFRGCSSVKTTIPTPNGVISASWQRNSRSADVTLDLPQDVVASVVLPGEQAEASTGLSRWSVTLPGISGG